ncbi:hypothetical protein [Andreprevotia chitinilytica]|uniref:hypothetical protein n=1 Tax=Andreprevotia chitinilytica TaxID=396808 RepID=UPI000554D2B0|nr:hypothetical protein [Andreprevotia chitinilytica]
MANEASSTLGALTDLAGEWHGAGLCVSYLPTHAKVSITSDIFLIKEIAETIPNRGNAFGSSDTDIEFKGLDYTHTIHDNAGTHDLLHYETGQLLNIISPTPIPDTNINDKVKPYLVQLALNPNGYALNTWIPVPVESINKIDIPPVRKKLIDLPLTPGDFKAIFGTLPAGITEEDLNNPNQWLAKKTEEIHTNSEDYHSTSIQFASDSSHEQNPDHDFKTTGNTGQISTLKAEKENPASIKNIDTSFWIEKYKEGTSNTTQLQYSQQVVYTIDGKDYTQISVATLKKM